MFACLDCGGKTKVLKTTGNIRRVHCTSCSARFTTEEVLADDTVRVNKKEYEAFQAVMQAAKRGLHLTMAGKR